MFQIGRILTYVLLLNFSYGKSTLSRKTWFMTAFANAMIIISSIFIVIGSAYYIYLRKQRGKPKGKEKWWV